MHTNRLIEEKSPYLLQHAHNPVDWYPWNEEAFAKARSEDKPIFLSVGYSTCHWCHVMERESFENDDIAAVLNRHFVPIKLDREERPDVDRIYMTFVQATTGSGGWPMSVWLTPDLKPFFGGTYFPPDNRYGRPGFRHILEQLASAWLNDRTRIEQSGRDIVGELKRYSEASSGGSLNDEGIERGFMVFRRMFDARHGGFGSAPKFPRPAVLNFLLRHHHRTGNEEALEMVLRTLDEMAKGGMNDQLGGGFHRYSVDERWFVPHFEKMLYDQAQLVIAYIEAFQITGEQKYASVASETLDYVLRDMTSREGAFYSAEDADSVIDPAKPHEKGEGAFYIWSFGELEQALGAEHVEWFAYRYGVERGGNVHTDPHGEFTGRNILYQAHTLEETAQHFGAEPGEVSSALTDAGQTLLELRGKRVRPHLDDKVLVAWNGLMISAFSRAAQALDEPRYAEAASRAVQFLSTTMRRDARLMRRFREGEVAVAGLLDDYAFFVQALLDLYETDFDCAHLELAVSLAGTMLDEFEDKEAGGLFSTPAAGPDLILRLKDDYDGAEPSGNAIAILSLLRLAHATANERFSGAAQRALQSFSRKLSQSPETLPQMLVALLWQQSAGQQIVIAGPRDDATVQGMLRLVGSRFLPNRVVLLSDDRDRACLERHSPAAAMAEIDGKPAAYVCENFACKLPATDLETLEKLLT